VIILIFDPDPSDEASFVLVVERRDIKNQAPDFAQEFAAEVFKLVVLTIEAGSVRVDHLEETGGGKPVVDELPPAFGKLALEANTAVE
jgi:hypothetical protein